MISMLAFRLFYFAFLFLTKILHTSKSGIVDIIKRVKWLWHVLIAHTHPRIWIIVSLLVYFLSPINLLIIEIIDKHWGNKLKFIRILIYLLDFECLSVLIGEVGWDTEILENAVFEGSHLFTHLVNLLYFGIYYERTVLVVEFGKEDIGFPIRSEMSALVLFLFLR